MPDPSDHRYPLPTVSIFEGVSEYIPLLLAAVDEELGREDVWEEDEVEEALGYVEDVRAWLQDLEAYMIPVGGIILWFNVTIPPNFLVCDGTSHNKVDYPALYALLAGNVDETLELFSTPELSLRLPMGVGSSAELTLDLGEKIGEIEHAITAAEMPEHNHRLPEHGHTSAAHTHVQDAHTHVQNAHNHSATDSGHTHNMPVRDTSAVGAQDFVASTNNSGTAGTTPTSSGTAAVTIGNTTPTNQNATANNQNATVTINEAAEIDTDFKGGDIPMSLLNPVIGVFYIIRAF